jgi:hypothetical protein
VPFVLLLVVVVAILAVGLVFWTRQAASCSRRIGAPPGGEPSRVITGDVMCKAVLTSGSFGRLQFYDWGIRIRGIPLTRWIVPTWEARYEELAIAELVTLRYSRIAVWLRLRGSTEQIGFLTQWNQDVLGLLEKHEVPVNRAVTQYSRVSEVYGPH